MTVTLYQPLGDKPDDFFRVLGSDERCGENSQKPSAPAIYEAPSIKRGQKEYERMLKSDSPTQSWRVRIKTDRRARTVYGDQLPAGFPHLYEFFVSSKSLRVFSIGFQVYRTLYDDVQLWNTWHKEVTNVGQWEVQALRSEILRVFSPSLNNGKKPSTLMLSILRFTVQQRIWPLNLASSMPKRVRLEVRWDRIRSLCKLLKYGLAWLKHHNDCKEKNVQHNDESVYIFNSTPLSPSLKRKRPDN